jgi:UDPglucose--hexose-1-phosphate uridylyltransferase
MMGCSNNHPHGQVWSLSEVPSIPTKELESLECYSLSGSRTDDAPHGPEGEPNQSIYAQMHLIHRYSSGRPCLLCEYVSAEVKLEQENGRVVLKNENWVALVPWWAVWPFELLRGSTLHDHSNPKC